MTLKLFRSTGYSTMLLPGEARLAPRPAWAVAAVGTWIALACNVSLWRALVDMDTPALLASLAQALAVGGATGAFLSLVCWRRTLKPLASALLVLAATSASSTWLHKLPADLAGSVTERIFPGWAALLDWRVSTMLALLGLVPVLMLWTTQLRRLTGPVQLQANLKGFFLGAALGSAGGLLLQTARY